MGVAEDGSLPKFFSEGNKLLVIDGTSTNKDHTVSLVVVLNVAGELGLGDVENVFLRAKDGATKRLVLESNGVEVVKTTSSYCLSTSSDSLMITSRSRSIADSSSFEF